MRSEIFRSDARLNALLDVLIQAEFSAYRETDITSWLIVIPSTGDIPTLVHCGMEEIIPPQGRDPRAFLKDALRVWNAYCVVGQHSSGSLVRLPKGAYWARDPQVDRALCNLDGELVSLPAGDSVVCRVCPDDFSWEGKGLYISLGGKPKDPRRCSLSEMYRAMRVAVAQVTKDREMSQHDCRA